jgi:signal transduction histidine kinase
MSVATGEHNQFYDGPLADGLPSIVAAAHELKSPLALMRQLSLSLEDNNVSDADRKRMLRQITLTSERALRLTSDLTKSVRLEDAMFDLEPINPYQLCQDVAREISPLFAAHHRNIYVSSKRHSWLLVANRDLLKRIIMNFSDNALYYAEGAGDIEIKISTVNSGRQIRLGVRDYGPAVPKSIINKLKNNLSMGPAPIHTRPSSSGLGLYISSQFADAMNGKIGITRHRDGATFFVELQASSQLSLL